MPGTRATGKQVNSALRRLLFHGRRTSAKSRPSTRSRRRSTPTPRSRNIRASNNAGELQITNLSVTALIATGVNADGCREILGVDVTSSEDGAGWLAFLRGLVARGLSGVALVISDDHAGLVNAIAAVLPGAAWQRCRTHYADLGIMPIRLVKPLVAAA